MKRILITGAGGAPSLNFTRSLRQAPEEFHLIGVDCDEFYLCRAETEERYLVPRASEPDYIDIIAEIVRGSEAEIVFAQPDPEVAALSEARDELGAVTFLPSQSTVTICQDKWETYSRWREAGLKVPETKLVGDRPGLKAMFKKHGQLWLRATKGAAGRGAFHAQSLEDALAWLEFKRGWGSFTAAEYLSPDSVTWQSIWVDGELVVAQGRRRLYWEFADRAPSGVTGLTGAAVTVSDEQVDEAALRAILAIDGRPHGIFSVDLTYDSQGVPNPTEINIGRFFTTHFFFTAAGLNMPYIAVKAALAEELPAISRKVNPLPEGLLWIRGMDKEPVLTSLEATESYRRQLAQRREQGAKLASRS